MRVMGGRPRGGQAQAALLAALMLVATGCTTNILHGIDERAANDAARALERSLK